MTGRTEPRPPECRACGSTTQLYGSAVVLLTQHVSYYSCAVCGSVCTEEPTWLSQAYEDSITRLDVGLLRRCLWAANITETVCRLGRLSGRVLDWGGGYGTLTRLLRDRGLDCRHYDPYTPNIFARGFEKEDVEGHWGLVTLFEVVEHLWTPRETLRNIALHTDAILLSTELIERPAPAIKNWWYFAPETGQHVSFLTLDGLKSIAAECGMTVISDGRSVHLLSRPGAVGQIGELAVRAPRLAKLGLPHLARIIGLTGRGLTEVDAQAALHALRS